jgi:glucosylglycerate synthase
LVQDLTASEAAAARKLDAIGRVEIVVGIACYNNARTVRDVMKSVDAGIVKYFPESRSALILSDGGSFDETAEIASQTDTRITRVTVSHHVESADKLATPYHGIPGKDDAVRGIFQAARRLRAGACIILDANLEKPPPEWMETIAGAIVKDEYAFVAPYFRRQKHGGVTTRNIIYPLMRTLYGKRIRHPVGGPFGISGELMSVLLKSDIWSDPMAQYGVELGLLAAAVRKKARICEADLGAKVAERNSAPADLPTTLYQVVGSVFALMEAHSETWKPVKGSEAVPLVGSPQPAPAETPLPVSLDRMRNAFRLGLAAFSSLWEGVLSQEAMEGLRALGDPAADRLYVSDELWVRLIYDTALAAHRKTIGTEHLLKSFTPIYLGRLASFIEETDNMSDTEFEDRIETLCGVFEREKDYLVKQWNIPAKDKN